jgi:hypothetical protein
VLGNKDCITARYVAELESLELTCIHANQANQVHYRPPHLPSEACGYSGNWHSWRMLINTVGTEVVALSRVVVESVVAATPTLPWRTCSVAPWAVVRVVAVSCTDGVRSECALSLIKSICTSTFKLTVTPPHRRCGLRSRYRCSPQSNMLSMCCFTEIWNITRLQCPFVFVSWWGRIHELYGHLFL